MPNTPTEETVDEQTQRLIGRLIDKDEIRDLMARYARAVDRMDLDALREVYHPDAYDDHGDYKGGPDGLVDYVRERLGPAPQAMHFLGQCHIEFTGPDVALVETYFMTAHTLGSQARAAYGLGDPDSHTQGDGAGEMQLSMFGRYVDRTERREGVWRIARRDTVFESTRILAEPMPPIDPTWLRHRRDHDDVVFTRLEEMKS